MHAYPHHDVRDLLGMSSRGAWLILAFYLAAMVTVTAATLGHLTAAWPAVLGTAILVAATIALVAVPGDPLPLSTTIALTVAGPLACALYLAVTPADPQFSLQTWIHGGGTTLYCFMNVRGRRIAPWIGLAGRRLRCVAGRDRCRACGDVRIAVVHPAPDRRSGVFPARPEHRPHRRTVLAVRCVG